MSRHRKIEEDSWDEEEEQAATDHVVERFLAQQERGEHGLPRKLRPGQRGQGEGVRAASSFATIDARKSQD